MQRPLIPLLIALMAGIITGNHVVIPDALISILLIASLITLLFFIFMKRERGTSVSLLASLFCVGLLTINLSLWENPRKGDISLHTGRERISIEGIISQNPRVFRHKTDLVVTTSKVITSDTIIPVHGDIILSVKDNTTPFKYGDVIRAKTRLKIPHNFSNPGGFDYERHLRYRGITARGFVDTAKKIVLIRENSGIHVKRYLERFRTLIRALIHDNTPPQQGNVLKALLLGERGEIPEDILENFKRAGVSHILAISGLHIGIIAFLSVLLIQTIMKSSEYLLLKFNIVKVSALLSTVPILIYAFVAGFGISTVRATIMILSFLGALFVGRERDLLNTLAFAAFVILIIAPASVFDVSFQLSFAAVAAILIITPRVSAFLPVRKYETSESIVSRKNHIIRRILLFVIVSLAATIGTLPLMAYYFNRISTMTLVSNMVIIPVVGFIILPVGMLAVVFTPWAGPLAVIMIKAASFCVGMVVSVINFLGSFSFSSFPVSTPTLVELVLYYSLIIAGIIALDIWNSKEDTHEETGHHRKTLVRAIFFTLLFLIVIVRLIFLPLIKRTYGFLEATFLDVGQGSSTLVKFPEGTTMLVDGGGFYTGTFDVGRYVVAPFLWHERIKKIDIVVLTHPDQDHMHGLLYILKNFTVREVWTNGEETDSESYKALTRLIPARHITHRQLSEESPMITIDGTTITVLNPAGPIVYRNESRGEYGVNDHALVMEITYGSTRIVLPSDVSAPVERRLVAEGKVQKTTALLVPHHGGFRSSTGEFLAATKPDIAIVSCGKGDSFRNLHPDVLQRYRKIRSKVLRTDINGAITVKTDGKVIITSCFKGN